MLYFYITQIYYLYTLVTHPFLLFVEFPDENIALCFYMDLHSGNGRDSRLCTIFEISA